ncbi:hypothetical protein SASPL_118694 [Salvia splendens]|uniref:Uncharacterized protein n=1 Tax=Salvia splendens TaxID=180675 RepID=A0A8X8Y2U7_SALSN|nr:hypothetical protein SASPL_118694 [Salvia splendens]
MIIIKKKRRRSSESGSANGGNGRRKSASPARKHPGLARELREAGDGRRRVPPQGPAARLNFPCLAGLLPKPASHSATDVQAAAQEAAMQIAGRGMEMGVHDYFVYNHQHMELNHHDQLDYYPIWD